MKAKNVNNSSLKTKKAIKLAFAELLKEKQELSKITVKDLVKIADINRGTFYLHYDNIYAVAEEFEEEILQTLKINSQDFNSLEQLYTYFDNIITYLKNNENLYKKLLSSNEPLLFLNKINKLITDKLYKFLLENSKNYNSKSLKFDVTFLTDGIINQILRYFTEEYEYSLEDICNYMKKYIKIIFYHNKNI